VSARAQKTTKAAHMRLAGNRTRGAEARARAGESDATSAQGTRCDKRCANTLRRQFAALDGNRRQSGEGTWCDKSAARVRRRQRHEARRVAFARRACTGAHPPSSSATAGGSPGHVSSRWRKRAPHAPSARTRQRATRPSAASRAAGSRPPRAAPAAASPNAPSDSFPSPPPPRTCSIEGQLPLASSAPPRARSSASTCSSAVVTKLESAPSEAAPLGWPPPSSAPMSSSAAATRTFKRQATVTRHRRERRKNARGGPSASQQQKQDSAQHRAYTNTTGAGLGKRRKTTHRTTRAGKRTSSWTRERHQAKLASPPT
jgi:hypothetical protein